MNSHINLAFKIAENSTHLQYKMAAVVVLGGAVIATAHNRHERYKCCERRALRPHMNVRGATIIIVRSNHGISKPCKFCSAAIIAAGIKKVVYFDHDGKIVISKPTHLN